MCVWNKSWFRIFLTLATVYDLFASWWYDLMLAYTCWYGDWIADLNVSCLYTLVLSCLAMNQFSCFRVDRIRWYDLKCNAPSFHACGWNIPPFHGRGWGCGVCVCVCLRSVCVCALNLNSCQLIFGAAWLREETNNHFTKSKGAALVGFVFAAGWDFARMERSETRPIQWCNLCVGH